MRPNESFIGQPVRSLQTMLRVLGEHDSRYHPVIPDGIYGKETMAAVANFQRQHGLAATGVADQETWEQIHDHYDPARVYIEEAIPLEIILNPNEILVTGDQSPYLYIVQAVLIVLSQVYGIGTPSMNGILDSPTEDSLASFQQLIGLPMTGKLDKLTWKHLALHFPLAANLGRGGPQREGSRM